MTHWLVPGFPSVPGPYPVGTAEVEIPVSSLIDGLSGQEGVRIHGEKRESTIETILFRIFYPASQEGDTHSSTVSTNVPDPEKYADGARWGWTKYVQGLVRRRPATSGGSGNPVYWVPEPYQHEYLKAYMRFGGMSRKWLLDMVGYIPNPFNHITISARENLPLRQHVGNHAGFPTMVFSHGLGGSRLAYSQFCCSMASHGVVVVAPEHRDGSGPLSIVRKRTGDDELKVKMVDYLSAEHKLTVGMSNIRDFQLSIRSTEIGLVYKALTYLNKGVIPNGTISGTQGNTESDAALRIFKNKLDIDTPGRVIWAGHSFGAATMVQFIKSVYYMGSENAQPSLLRLPEKDIALLQQQVTKQSPLQLLDMWCLSLLGSKRTYWLWKKPLPQVLPLDEGEIKSTSNVSPLASRVLTIMSYQFYVWKENMWAVKWLLSRDPGARDGAVREIFHYDPMTGKELSEKDEGVVPDPSASEGILIDGDGYRPPKLFYAKKSAHMSQSDFNLLFPFFLRKQVPEPERILSLNIRATVQWLREAGYRGEIAPHSAKEAKLDDCEIFENAEDEEIGDAVEEAGKKSVLEGWVRLGLHEEKVKRKAVQKSVEEGMEAGGEGELA